MGTAVYSISFWDRPKGSSEAPTRVVKRGRLEEKVVLVAVEMETLAEAFAYLKERLVRERTYSKLQLNSAGWPGAQGNRSRISSLATSRRR